MDTDDLEPRKITPAKPDLEGMSIGGLEEYISDLEAEIDRARQAIARKGSARTAAETFFKLP